MTNNTDAYRVSSNTIEQLNIECSVYLDSLDGTYVVDVFGYPMPILLDQHEVSWYANAEDPAFDEIEMNS